MISNTGDTIMNTQGNNYGEEKLLNPKSGIGMLLFALLLTTASTAVFVLSVVGVSTTSISIPLAVVGIVLSSIVFTVSIFMYSGLKVINPNEAGVYLLFGRYYGTINKPGFFFVNPFCTSFNPNATVQLSTNSVSIMNRKVSTKAITLNNEKQKVNDSEGNPIEIGVVVIYRVINATKAVFEVEHYSKYVSTQADASIRQVARKYPYDITEGEDERSLRGSSNEVADELIKELQQRVDIAGVEILEARITHLSYAQEIAAAMLQRQQAKAIIDARQKIVEGAVGMVKMALEQLDNDGIVELDEERKAAMISNLLVVLCANKDTQPIVNSGSIY